MDLTASAGGLRAAPTSAISSATPSGTSAATARGWPAAMVLLAGTLLGQVGATWDIQWHTDVGPDTFFTLPHLFLYSGAAISGLASLAVVLITTAAQRAGRPVDQTVGGRAVGVFGRTFAAPVGYLVAGVGAASFLLYGLWDLWWHSLYGFDAVIDSPPHIGLFLSNTVTTIGLIMVFAAARPHRWGAIGALAGVAILLVSSTITVLAVQQLNGTVNWTNAGTGMLTVLFLVMAAGFFARPGGALITAVVVAAVQAVFWWFAPWAAQAYAGAVGLPMRDYARLTPVTAALIPLCLIPMAAILDLVLLRAHRRPAAARWPAMLAGGVGGLIVAACAPYQRWLIYGGPAPDLTVLVATAIAAAVLGLIGGILGWRFGGMLRLLAPTLSAPSSEGRPA